MGGFFSHKAVTCSCPHTAPYVILDTETTGKNQYKDKAVQVSAIRYDVSGTPIETYDTYLAVDRPISPEATAVNHISRRKLRGAPAPTEAKDGFLRFIGDDLLIGYNVTFDLRILSNTFGIDFTGREYVDALKIAKGFFFFLPDCKLETVASYIGFTPRGSFHNALADCEAVAAVLADVSADLSCHIRSFAPSVPHSRWARKEFHVEPREMTADEVITLAHHPFFGKRIVFTGDLSVTRQEAAQMVSDVGGAVKSSVSRKTDYLVVGVQDVKVVGTDGMRGKEEQAHELNKAGKANIQIIDEAMFFDLLRGKEECLL